MFNTSRSLLERLRDRTDGEAWQRLLTIYEPWLRGWLARTELRPADRDDVVQEVLVVVSEKLQTFAHNGHPGAFRAWLRLILTNHVRHFLRNQRNRPGGLAPQPLTEWLDQLADPESTLSRQWDQEHDQYLVRRMLASIQGEINPTTWQVFRMLVIEERPAAEVARGMGITPNAVYVAKARVLARLREELRGLIDT